MPPSQSKSSSLDEIAASLLAKKGLELVSCQTVQSLWAGYGHICRVQAQLPPSNGDNKDGQQEPLSLVLKYINPPATKSQDDEGHLRKILSYQVEQHFYAHLAPRLLLSHLGGGGGDEVAVAECLGSVHDGTTTALLLRDLQREVPAAYESCFQLDDAMKAAAGLGDKEKVAAAPSFPLALEKRGTLTPDLVDAALDWLAGFHGFFWRDEEKARYAANPEHLVPPPLEFAAAAASSSTSQSSSSNKNGAAVVHGVWQNGGYTYLATRRSEYANLEEEDESEWSDALCRPSSSSSGGKSVAEEVAYYLSPLSPRDVALRDPDPRRRQIREHYVGVGLGVCDLAKLFTCSVPVSLLAAPAAASFSISPSLGMQPGEKALLERYLARLEAVSGRGKNCYPWDVFVRHWEAALVDWLRFQASWGFWGNTAWLEARVREILSRKKTAEDWEEEAWR
ncbi:proline iminopeptidase [Apiospora arundinis]